MYIGCTCTCVMYVHCVCTCIGTCIGPVHYMYCYVLWIITLHLLSVSGVLVLMAIPTPVTSCSSGLSALEMSHV